MIERRVINVVDAQDGIERAALTLVREFHPIDVVGRSTRLERNGNNLVLRNVDEFCTGIDEATDQPRAGNSVDLRAFPRHPLAGTGADVAARRQSLLDPIAEAAFQKIRL